MCSDEKSHSDNDSLALSDHPNSNKQGNVGLGDAIAYFTKLGYIVCIPLTDSQDYDLVIEKDNGLQKVQVKTSIHKTQYRKKDAKGKNTIKYGPEFYRVQLATKGGIAGRSCKKFDSSRVDYLYILTQDRTKYLIPTEVLNVTSSLDLTNKYDDYRLE